jgi:heme/copper-type cytochrome/quinol oxidase subunit 2
MVELTWHLVVVVALLLGAGYLYMRASNLKKPEDEEQVSNLHKLMYVLLVLAVGVAGYTYYVHYMVREQTASMYRGTMCGNMRANMYGNMHGYDGYEVPEY